MKELKAKKQRLADETEHQKREIDHERKILSNKLRNRQLPLICFEFY